MEQTQNKNDYRCPTCNHLWLHKHMAKACEEAHKRAFFCSYCGSCDLDRWKDQPFSEPFRETHHVWYDCNVCGYSGHLIDGYEEDEVDEFWW